MGLFWDEEEKNVKQNRRPLPGIPFTGWKTRSDFPDLSSAKAIAIDTETYDPELTDAGPGWARGRGHIVGVSIATDDGFKCYYPVRHTISTEDNLDPAVVFKWLREQLSRPHQVKVGANLIYDIGWLRMEGVQVKGKLHDVQFAEVLIDETASVALETLGQKYLGLGKESSKMYSWLSDAYGGPPSGVQRKNIWRCPPSLVGAYAESDATLPLEIIRWQYPQLEWQGLLEVYDLECRLIPLLVDMRYQGVRVDLDKANKAHDELIVIERDHQIILNEQCGFDVKINSGPSLAKAFDKFAIQYPRTEKGAPSFTSDFLKTVTHPLAKEVQRVRQVQKARSTFIDNYILKKNVDGRLYGSFHPLKGDSGGTVSGRFSSSDPNLQNLPARDPVLGPLIRGCFVPDAGQPGWRAFDYSSIEYRFLAHYAVGQGADAVRAVFNKDPFADYHQIVCDMVNDVTDVGLERKPAKTINFGLVYGMGLAKLAASLGLTDSAGKALVETYFGALPYVKQTLEHYGSMTGREGFIATILGRRSHFTQFVPSTRNGRNEFPLPYEEAVAKWGSRVERVGLHKAVNRLLQGSAADLMKKAMVDCYEAGLFNDLMPSLTVHDELDWSDPCEAWSDKQFKEIRHIMETAIPNLKVPIIVACDRGTSWGDAKEVAYDSI